MEGDFSRFTFDPKKNYTGVLLQQGRVLLDSDWNAQVQLDAYLRQRSLADLIGALGAPAGFPGFGLVHHLENTTPADLNQALSFLRNGFRNYDGNRAVRRTRVFILSSRGKRLAFLPGGLNNIITFQNAGDDPTAAQLKLIHAKIIQIPLYPLPELPALDRATPKIKVRFGDTPMQTAVLERIPESMVQAADLLERAIQAASPDPRFSLARVVATDRAFAIVPGDLRAMPAFADDSREDTTASLLGLVKQGPAVPIHELAGAIPPEEAPGSTEDPVERVLSGEIDIPSTIVISITVSGDLSDFPEIESSMPRIDAYLTDAGEKKSKSQEGPYTVELLSRGLGIAYGRCYVAGLLLLNYWEYRYFEEDPEAAKPGRSSLPFNLQPFYPGVVTPTEAGEYHSYLSAWVRNLNYIQAPGIREIALGGPDTTTRVQAEWRIDLIEGDDQWMPPKSTGRMMAQLAQTGAEQGNNLYIIQIQRGGDYPNDAVDGENVTFKWSRNDGATVFAIEDLMAEPDSRVVTLVLDSEGRDLGQALQIGQWVEICIDYTELNRIPGLLLQIESIEADLSQIVTLMPETVTFPDYLDPSTFERPFIRAWNQEGLETELEDGAVIIPAPENDSDDGPIQTSPWIDIENGIQVAFKSGLYQNGDYWLFTSRSEDNAIFWPVFSDGSPMPEPIFGPIIYTVPTGQANFNGIEWNTIDNTIPTFEGLANPGRFSGHGSGAKKAGPVNRMSNRIEKLAQRVAELEATLRRRDQSP